MDEVLKVGVDIIVAIQHFHGPLQDNIIHLFSYLGDEQFFLILLSAIFWCVDFQTGAEIAILLSISGYLHTGIKDLLQQPRPFEIDSRVLQLADATGYGLPSGHTQSATAIWGSIAARARRLWLWVVAILAIVLVGFSRVYLGVHFPTDVLAGLCIGIIVVVLYIRFRVSLGQALSKLNIGIIIVLALLIPVVLLVIHPVTDNAGAMGVLAGLGVGLPLTNRYIHFKAGGPWRIQALRLVIGLILVLGFYIGLRMVLPSGETALYLALRFVRYAIIGFVGSFFCPWLFLRLRWGNSTRSG